MKKILLALFFAFTIVITGCSIEGENAEVTQKAETEKTAEELKIGVSISTLNNPFFVSVRDGLQEVADANKSELIIYDAQNDSSTQSNQIDDLLQQNVDMIIVNPVDSQAISTSIQAINAANIPVIAVDRGADEGTLVSLIASNNVEGGKMAGEFMLEQLGENPKILQLEGIPGASSTRERGEGFAEATEGKIELLGSQTANFDRAEGMTVMENLLQANPEVQGVFAQNDEMALGAVEAIKASGKDIIVVGFDGTEDALKAVEDGTLSATVAQKPLEMGKIAMQAAIDYFGGKEIEKNIASPLELIKK